LSNFLASIGVLVAAAGATGAILLPAGRLRAAAMLVALVLFPALILGDQWHSHQIADLRDDPSRLVLLGLLALGVSAGLAYLFDRWPILLPLAVVAALPFRIPLHAGGDTANLLVPLYLVIAGGVLASTARTLRAGPAGGVGAARGGVTWLPRVLAAVVVLYAVQVLYSADFSKGLQNVCFFFVPFSLMYGLLCDVSWDRKLLTLVVWVVGLEAVAFVIVGSVEWVSRSLFWNDQVIRSNEFHTYFRVNSMFWDPNVYGRYLALVAVVATSVLLWARERRTFALLTALIAVLWIGLFPTYSQSSYVALLAGLAVLAALKWSLKWTLAAVGVAAVLGIAVVLFAGGVSKLSPDRCNVDTAGRCNLVTGGAKLFGQRPIWGYGSGSFPKAYRQHIDTDKIPVSVSHTEPITVAAEQGLLGLLAYTALVVTALWTMASGNLISSATGPARLPVARAAVLATFIALLVHTMAYAGFFEDPITWVLLAMGISLAAESGAASSAFGRARS
jgi:O-antigen ligase